MSGPSTDIPPTRSATRATKAPGQQPPTAPQTAPPSYRSRDAIEMDNLRDISHHLRDHIAAFQPAGRSRQQQQQQQQQQQDQQQRRRACSFSRSALILAVLIVAMVFAIAGLITTAVLGLRGKSNVPSLGSE